MVFEVKPHNYSDISYHIRKLSESGIRNAAYYYPAVGDFIKNIVTHGKEGFLAVLWINKSSLKLISTTPFIENCTEETCIGAGELIITTLCGQQNYSRQLVGKNVECTLVVGQATYLGSYRLDPNIVPSWLSWTL